jgi:multimeric flavodoxin WrbA
MAMVVAIIGSYRRGGITDQAVDAVLEGARAGGARTEKIYLI